jgi:hypothetical protein
VVKAVRLHLLAMVATEVQRILRVELHIVPVQKRDR